MPTDDASDRLTDQRLRNRMMDSLDPLAQGDQGVLSAGVVDYFEDFFSVIDDEFTWDWRDYSTLTSEEVAALDQVLQVVKAAVEATPRMIKEDEFVATGWPARIQPVASTALQVMERRGRFSEEVEENEPSR
jgi:hypothetical protein